MQIELDVSLLSVITTQLSIDVPNPKSNSATTASYLFKNQTKFTGEVHNHIPENHGSIVWPDHTEYVGVISKGNISGYGKMVWENGEEYIGNFIDGLRHGHGKFSSSNDEGDLQIYDGNFVAGYRDGVGEMKYNDSTVYSGEWRSNLRHGKGKMSYCGGDIEYNGDWKAGVKCGQGEMVFHSLFRVYKGEFSDDMPNGQGEVTWLKQMEPIVNSEGKTTDKKFMSIDGVDKAKNRENVDKPVIAHHDVLGEGPGLVGIQRYNSYKGEMVNGERSGFGIMSFSNGSQYIGGWMDDRRHGQGIVVHEDGSCHAASYQNGVADLLTNNTATNESINSVICIDVDDVIQPLVSQLSSSSSSQAFMDKTIMTRDLKNLIQNKILQYTIELNQVFKMFSKLVDPSIAAVDLKWRWQTIFEANNKTSSSTNMVLSIPMSSVWKCICLIGLGQELVHQIDVLNIYICQYMRNKIKLGLLDDIMWIYTAKRRDIINWAMNGHLSLNEFIELLVRIGLTIMHDSAAVSTIDDLPAIKGLRSVFDTHMQVLRSSSSMAFWNVYQSQPISTLIDNNQEKILSLMEECKGCSIRILENLLQRHVMDSNDEVCWLWSSMNQQKQSNMTYPNNADLCCWLISMDVIVLEEAIELEVEQKQIIVLEKVIYDENIALSLPVNLRIGPRVGLIELSPDEFVTTIALTSMSNNQANVNQIKTRLCECLGIL